MLRGMVTRRIFEVVVITSVLLVPVLGSARLWARKTMAGTQAGSPMQRVAEVVSIMT